MSRVQYRRLRAETIRRRKKIVALVAIFGPAFGGLVLAVASVV